MPSFQVHPLDHVAFAPLFALSDHELAQRGIQRMHADTRPGFPCRISLDDAAIGDEVLLLSWEHLPAASPYRAAGPIFVRRGAIATHPDVDEVPAFLQRRLLSLRGYDAAHRMIVAEVCEGAELVSEIRRLFEDPSVDYLHLHNARRGCYMTRVTRATQP